MIKALILSIAVLLAVTGSCGIAHARLDGSGRYVHLDVGTVENEADAANKCEAARLKWQSEHKMFKTALWTGRVEKDPYSKNSRCEIRYYGGKKDIAYVQSEPIDWKQPMDAQDKCTAAMEKWRHRHHEVRDASWTGEWVFIDPSRTPVCMVEYSTRSPDTVLYQFNTGQRTGNLRQVCEPARQQWQKDHSQYKTVLWTGYAHIGGYGIYTCELRYSTEATDIDYVDAGPIFVTDDPAAKCADALKYWQAEHREAADARWTGKWETTIPGKMAVCEIRYSTK